MHLDIFIHVTPLFLVEGPVGSGKFELIKILAEILGLHLFAADFADIQCLTSAQTEAKLRIILQEAEHCVPCILALRNIQVMWSKLLTFYHFFIINSIK
jgi:SpoVK/Ycf46/Vps4 family AAA+-type ATPase